MPVEGAVRLHEPVLRRVLGIGGPTTDEIRDPCGQWLIRAHQLRVRVHVTFLRATDEVGIVGWTALH